MQLHTLKFLSYVPVRTIGTLEYTQKHKDAHTQKNNLEILSFNGLKPIKAPDTVTYLHRNRKIV